MLRPGAGVDRQLSVRREDQWRRADADPAGATALDRGVAGDKRLRWPFKDKEAEVSYPGEERLFVSVRGERFTANSTSSRASLFPNTASVRGDATLPSSRSAASSLEAGWRETFARTDRLSEASSSPVSYTHKDGSLLRGAGHQSAADVSQPSLVDIIRSRHKDTRGADPIISSAEGLETARRSSPSVLIAAEQATASAKPGGSLHVEEQGPLLKAAHDASAAQLEEAQQTSPVTPRQVRIQTTDSRQPPSPEVTAALRERVAMLETLLANTSPLKVASAHQPPKEDEESSSRTLSEDSIAARSAPVRGKRRNRSVRISQQSSCFDSGKSGSPSPRSRQTQATDSRTASVAFKSGKIESDGTSDAAEGAASPASRASGLTAPQSPVAKAGTNSKGKGKGPPPPKGGGGKGSDDAAPAPPKGKGKSKGPPPKAPPRGAAKAGLTKQDSHNPRKAEIQPRLPMKKLFWNAFVLDDEHLKSCESVWVQIEKDNPELFGFDAQELELHFSEPSTRSGAQTPASQGGSLAVHRRTRLRARVFEESRRKQVCIMLARLPPVETTVKAIHDMDDECLDKDQVELLLATAPTTEELAMLRAAAKEMPDKASLPWDDAEDFVWKLSEVGHFLVRLQTWSFENAFDERYHIFHSAVTEVKDACHALRDSQRIPRLLGIMLHVGNYLNAGTSRGRADGFSVEVLSQVRALKGQAASSSSASTLLDFVVRQAERNKPGELLQLFGEVGEATLVQRAFRHNLKELSLELTAYCVQARGLARQSASGDDVLQARGEKVEAHLRGLETLQQLFVEAEEDFNSMCAWFHEGSGKKPRAPDEFFGYWHTFFQGIRSTLEGMYASKKRRKAPRSRVLRPLDQMAKSLTLSEAVKETSR